MSKLLPTRLPVANTPEISSEIYNRLVRVLEINLGEFDPDNTRQLTTPERDTLTFNVGSVIWNTDIGALQVFKGLYWEDISTPTNPQGLEAKSSVGSVTVQEAAGSAKSTSIKIGSSISGWGVEQYYT